MDDTEIAARAAKGFAKRHGIGYRWRELLGTAWEGTYRARAAGVSSTRELHRRAEFYVIDRYRTETGHKTVRKFSQKRCRQFKNCREDGRSVNTADTIKDRVTELGGNGWAETKHLRRWVTPTTNIMAYLYYVEGYDLWDVAMVFGVTDSGVSYALKRFADNVEYAILCNGTASAPRTSSPVTSQVHDHAEDTRRAPRRTEDEGHEGDTETRERHSDHR